MSMGFSPGYPGLVWSPLRLQGGENGLDAFLRHHRTPQKWWEVVDPPSSSDMAVPTSHFGEGSSLFRTSLTQAFGPLLCDTPVQWPRTRWLETQAARWGDALEPTSPTLSLPPYPWER